MRWKTEQVEITEAMQNKENRMKRNNDTFRDIFDNIKHSNITIKVVLEEEK